MNKDGKPMTTITKEEVKAFIEQIESDLANGWEAQIFELKLARIALASLEAEPIGAFHIADQQVGGTSDYIKDGEWPIDNGVIDVYAVPPVQETGVYQDMLNIIGLLENNEWAEHCTSTVLGSLLESEITRLVSKEQPTPVVPDEWTIQDAVKFCRETGRQDAGSAMEAWNACRAAMLQGGQPVSNRDELQVIGWLRSDYNSDDKRDPNAPLFMLGSNDPSDAWGVKYIPLSGNSPVIPGGWVMVPKKLTAENGAKSLLSGEFLETTFISCPECFADEECESCDGSGRIKIEVPVSWTTIKAIWNKGVEHFRSSAATGDN
ncbi:molecular chaperone DnaJ [Salmonella enterica subsp. enterica serovar Cubana]|uniref:molecular chaperone DnaJ n=1 Tax=Salmonella enterica TaxID=28901 RepID=UPI000FB16FDE|nr:molecular chaperone DnaJ [Salmonella enterica]EAA4495089.1 molecular chaperone DnaJ [Salmonella enterica subsp. enterica serovar Cubana]EAA8682934.1 molecular chaperone DnaJ [Salmonella enterica subsp. enterica serovar Orion]EAC0894257.1 molecular chaperone DnaJ [Salmonella enterica subsp. enterica serovar Virchow]EBH9901781.1 molecular chaperone DnaJ [Salmonella enterica subsp. enterica serovar Typhimurium var. 5-]EBM6563954.1 molecular chaperone DnaJ [Salmonella enterica subsp. enterica s